MANLTPGSSAPAADLAFINGKIATVNFADEVVDALAIRARPHLARGKARVC